MAGSERALIHFEGGRPMTNGVAMWIPAEVGESMRPGMVAGLAAVAALSRETVLAEAVADPDPLVGHLFCSLEYARRMPEFSKLFGGAPSKARAAVRSWIDGAEDGRLSEEDSWVARVVVEAHGFCLDEFSALASIGERLSALLGQAAEAGSSQESLVLARALAVAFRHKDDDPEDDQDKGGEPKAKAEPAENEAGDEGEQKPDPSSVETPADERNVPKAQEAPRSAGHVGGEPASASPRAGARDADSARSENDGVEDSAGLPQRKVDASRRAEDFLGGCFESLEARDGSGGASQGWEWERPATEDGAALSTPMFVDLDVVAIFDRKGDRAAEMELRRAASPFAQPMVSKLARALKTRERAAWSHEQERGHLNARSLAKLAASPGFRAPFKIKKMFESDSVAVGVLLDLSGSMHGENIEVARAAAMALAVALGRLGISCEIAGFSSGPCAEYGARIKRAPKTAELRRMLREGRSSERLELRVFKSFACASLSGLSKIEVDVDYRENPDGECVAWAGSRLAAQKAKRKILLVLSDGAPESGDASPSVLAKDLRSRLAALERAGIEAVGVGIGDDNVRHFYPRHIVVQKVADLAAEALGKLSDILLESGRTS